MTSTGNLEKGCARFYILRTKYISKAILVKLANGKNLMLDTGYDVKERDGAQAKSISEQLLDLGANKLDYILLSHYHTDHVYGFRSIVDDDLIDLDGVTVFLPQDPNTSSAMWDDGLQDIYNAINSRLDETTMTIIRTGAGQYIDGYKHVIGDLGENLEIYNTDHTYYYAHEGDYNNCSLSCYFNFGMKSVFFCGDIRASAQQKLLPNLRKVTCHVIEHHSVNGDLYDDYIRVLDPDFSIALGGITGLSKSDPPATVPMFRSQSRMRRYLRRMGTPCYATTENDGNLAFAISQYAYEIGSDIPLGQNGMRAFRRTLDDAGIQTLNAKVETSNVGANAGLKQLFVSMDDNSELYCNILASDTAMYGTGTFLKKCFASGGTLSLILRKTDSSRKTHEHQGGANRRYGMILASTRKNPPSVYYASLTFDPATNVLSAYGVSLTGGNPVNHSE